MRKPKKLPLPATGVTIGYSTTTLFMSWLIRLVSGGKYGKAKASHAWVAYDCVTLKTRMVLQAETHGYETIPWSRWVQKNVLVAEYRPLVDMSQHIPTMAQFLGQEYDYAAAFFSGAKRWMGKWLQRRFRSPNKMMCAEAQQYFLALEITLAPLNLHPELSLPEEVRAVIEERNFEYRKLR